MRGAAKVGRYADIDPLCISEMLDIVAKAIGLDKNYFLEKLPSEKIYHSAFQFNLRLIFIENGTTRKLLYWDYGECIKSKIVFSKTTVAAFFKIIWNTLLNEGIICLVKSLFSQYGPLTIFYKKGRPGFMNKLNKTKTIIINMYSWPDRHSIDLDETNISGSKHITFDGEILNFKDAVIRSEDL